MYEPKTYRDQGGDRQNIDNGGELRVMSGGKVDILSGGVFESAVAPSITVTSASTSGSTSVESMVVSMTMTGAAGVGGRARFQLDTNVALGGWANALKAYTKFGASGRITGLASALCAEMDLSAGCSAGTYAPIEIELNLGTGAITGTKTSLIYASVNGAAAGEFDDNGVILNLQGLTIGAGHVVQAAVKDGVKSTHALKILIGTTPYYIPLSTGADFNV